LFNRGSDSGRPSSVLPGVRLSSRTIDRWVAKCGVRQLTLFPLVTIVKVFFEGRRF
jgi:hypothetical protein